MNRIFKSLKSWDTLEHSLRVVKTMGAFEWHYGVLVTFQEPHCAPQLYFAFRSPYDLLCLKVEPVLGQDYVEINELAEERFQDILKAWDGVLLEEPAKV